MALLIHKVPINSEDMALILSSHGLGIVIASLAEFRTNHLLTKYHLAAFSISNDQALVYRIKRIFFNEYYVVFPTLYIIAFLVNPTLSTELKALYSVWVLSHALFLLLFITVLHDFLVSKEVSKHMPSLFVIYMMTFLMFINFSSHQYALVSPFHCGPAMVLLIDIDSTAMQAVAGLLVLVALCVPFFFLNRSIRAV